MVFERVLGASTSRGIKGPSRQGNSQGYATRALIMEHTYCDSGMRAGTGFNSLMVQGIVKGNSASEIPSRVDISRPVLRRIVHTVQTNVQGICRNRSRYKSVSFCLHNWVEVITILMAP